jgi:hypothetical protein
MRMLLTIAAFAGVLAAAAAPANAVPMPTGSVAIDAGSQATEVGWRCGPHRHWSWRLHRCVVNRMFRY